MSHQYYKGAIWTNHARERLGQRGLTQDLASQAFTHPGSSHAGKERGTVEYTKSVGTSLITVIAKQNEKKEWIILSCWIDPPLPRSIDIKKKERYRAYKRASFWGKLWLTFKTQIGL